YRDASRASWTWLIGLYRLAVERDIQDALLAAIHQLTGRLAAGRKPPFGQGADPVDEPHAHRLVDFGVVDGMGRQFAHDFGQPGVARDSQIESERGRSHPRGKSLTRIVYRTNA